jgi:hypothetical protein
MTNESGKKWEASVVIYFKVIFRNLVDAPGNICGDSFSSNSR